MIDITNILEALVALLAAVVTAVVVPYIRSRTTAQQQAALATLVKTAVTAAEQIYKGAGRGEDKKAYVLEWLRSHGVTVDGDRLDALIESAVYEMTNGVLTLGVAE